MTTPRGYDHVQRGRLHWLMYLITAVSFAAAGLTWGEGGEGRWIYLISGLVFLFIGLCFQQLRVRDLGDELDVRYGPLPLVGRRVAYRDIVGARAVRITFFDGWGIHWMPGQGWTWNLWGWDCVELDLGDNRLRVGTDDPAGLEAFLQERTRRKSS